MNKVGRHILQSYESAALGREIVQLQSEASDWRLDLDEKVFLSSKPKSHFISHVMIYTQGTVKNKEMTVTLGVALGSWLCISVLFGPFGADLHMCGTKHGENNLCTFQYE